MAVTITPLGGLTGVLKVIHDTVCNATAEKNVADGAATLYAVRIDNSANAAEAEYVKFYNSAAPIVGTTVPDIILPVAAAGKITYVFPGGNAIFTTALSYAGLTTGGTAGTTNPTASLIVTLLVR